MTSRRDDPRFGDGRFTQSRFESRWGGERQGAGQEGGGGGSAPCIPAYVTGDRTASIALDVSAGVTLLGPGNKILDGLFTDPGSAFFNSNFAVSGETIRFDFGVSVYVNEAKWYQDITSSHGSWKWQGSPDAAAWTDIGSAFVLGGVVTQTQTELGFNNAAYRYYRLLGVSGNASNASWLREIEFKQCTA